MNRCHRNVLLGPLLGLAVLAMATDARAALVALSNLPGSGDFSGLNGESLGSSNWAALGMGTGGEDLPFLSLTGEFSSFGSSTLKGGIYSDTAGQPGSLLSAFTDQAVGGSGTYKMVTSNPLTLLADTDYWFVLLDPPPALVWLRDSANTVPTAAPGYTHLGYWRSSDAGATWEATAHNLSVEIVLGEVPEPGTPLLWATALAALASVRRRRPY